MCSTAQVLPDCWGTERAFRFNHIGKSILASYFLHLDKAKQMNEILSSFPRSWKLWAHYWVYDSLTWTPLFQQVFWHAHLTDPRGEPCPDGRGPNYPSVSVSVNLPSVPGNSQDAEKNSLCFFCCWSGTSRWGRMLSIVATIENPIWYSI